MKGDDSLREDRPSATPEGVKLHVGIAEQGKLYALQGGHSRALHYYRVAMRLAVEAGDPEVFFRHYLDCVMESLEHMGAYAEVIAYCDKAIALYEERPPPNEMAVLDLATIHLRRGVVLLKSGDKDEARAAFERAVAVTRAARLAMPLAQTLLRWLRASFHIDVARVVSEQRRARYFTVRPDTVDPSRAIVLADAEKMFPGGR